VPTTKDWKLGGEGVVSVLEGPLPPLRVSLRRIAFAILAASVLLIAPVASPGQGFSEFHHAKRRVTSIPRNTPTAWKMGIDSDTIQLGQRVEFCQVVDWDRDGLVELAVMTRPHPRQVGVYSPAKQRWVDGPYVAPFAGTQWGAGDYDSDGTIEYAFKKADTICLFRPGIGSIERLWYLAGLAARYAFFWNGASTGSEIVAIEQTRNEPSGAFYIKRSTTSVVYRLLDGTFRTTHTGFASTVQLQQDLQDPFEWRIAMHSEIIWIYDNDEFPMGSSKTYLEELQILDAEWDGIAKYRLAYVDVQGRTPLDGYSLRDFSFLPARPGQSERHAIAVEAASGVTFSRGFYGFHTGNGGVDWSLVSRYSSTGYSDICGFDLETGASYQWILPSVACQCWELRNPGIGLVEDTILEMPVVDLLTNFLFDLSYPTLYYIADSLIVIRHGFPPEDVVDPSLPTSRIPLKAWPNPFNSGVTIAWPDTVLVSSICMVNVLGQSLWRVDFDPAKNHAAVSWDACDASGHPVASGVYFAKANGPGATGTVKLVLLR